MSNQDHRRCPSCDTANPSNATFCTHCGKPIGGAAADAPSEMYTGAVGAADGPGVKGYVVAAAAVAAVLIVGGALFFLADADDSGDTARTTPSVSAVASPVTAASTEVAPTEVATTLAPVASTPTAVAPTTMLPSTTVAPSTVAPTTVAATTVAPAPTPTAAPPPPPTAAPPIAAPPAQPTATPSPAVTLSFAQADSFFRSYVATAIGGDYNVAWNLLSSSDQADYPNGFDQFVGFWRSVSFAEVQRVESVGGSAGFQSLSVEMAYGQVDGDPTSFEIVEVDVNVRPDGSLQIFDYRYIRNQ